MTHHDDASTFGDVLAHFGDDGTKDLFRSLLEQALQDLIDAEVTAQIGAGRHERTDTRSNYRNGARERGLSTPAGDVELRIPKLRAGSFFPSLLEPRRRVDKALWAVIMTAYVTGTSTRKVDDLVKALGCDTGVSKSAVSRICGEIDEHVEVFRTRALDHLAFPYVYVDATYVKARVDHHIVSRAVVIATGVAADGNREVLGLDVGDSEDEVFWTQFLRSLKDRGLDGVKLVISDAHPGLKNAIDKVFQGTAWQRCQVHLMRNLMTHLRKRHKPTIGATATTTYVQPDPHNTRTPPPHSQGHHDKIHMPPTCYSRSATSPADRRQKRAAYTPTRQGFPYHLPRLLLIIPSVLRPQFL